MNEFFYDSCSLILKFSIPGILLSMVYDLFRLIRIGRNDRRHSPLDAWRKRYFPCPPSDKRQRKHINISEDILVFAEDILFCLIASFTEILAIYHINRGEIRIYCLMISVCVFFIYQKTVGKAFLILSTKILYLLRYVLYGVGCLILSPTLLFLKTVKRSARFFQKYFRKNHSENLF